MIEELDLRYIWGVINKRLKIILVLSLFAVLIATVGTFSNKTTHYEATTTLIVFSETERIHIQQGEISVSRMLVRTYGVLAKSRLVLEGVIDKHNLPISYRNLYNRVTINYVEGTEIMRINVRDSHPLLAQSIADEISENLISVVNDLLYQENIEIVDSATVSGPITSSGYRNIPVGLFIGIMLGVGLAFLLEFLDDTIKSHRDVRKILNLPVLGNIPVSPPRVKSFPCRDPLTAAYRFMVNNIQFAGLDKNIKSILVTPANPDGNENTLTANLGLIIAKGGSSVLLIDAVYNNPTLHKIFDLDNRKGFSNIIMDEDFVPEEVIKKTDNDKLFVVTAGSNGPDMAMAKPLSLPMVDKLLDYFSGLFDYIVFHTPQLITYTDVAVIASRVDASIMVFDHGEIHYQDAIFAKEQLERSRSNIIGAVISNVPSEHEENIIPAFNFNGKLTINGNGKKPSA